MWPLDGEPTRHPGPAGRPQPSLRLALLTLATAILLLGAVIAGVFCYESMGHGPIAMAGVVLMPACPVGLAYDI